MKFRTVMAGLLLGAAAVGTVDAGLWDNIRGYIGGTPEHAVAQKITVLVAHDQPGALLEVSGKYRLFDPNENKLISARLIGKNKYIQAAQDGIKWQEGFPGVHQLKIVPDDPNSVIFIDGAEYRGSIYVYDVGGAISIVNELNVEDYVSSVLAQQFKDPSLSEETLSAIAITARTHAYHQASNPRNRYWAVDGRQIGYVGYEQVNPSSPVQEAVGITKGMVLSQTEDVIKFFPSQWGSATGGSSPKQPGVFSRITLFEADNLAKKGHDASMILHKAFPGSSIQMQGRGTE